MSILTVLTRAGFAVAFVGYYALVWVIRRERLGATPSAYQMISNPFSLFSGAFTERGRWLRIWLLLDLALLVVLGLAAVLPHGLRHAVP